CRPRTPADTVVPLPSPIELAEPHRIVTEPGLHERGEAGETLSVPAWEHRLSDQTDDASGDSCLQTSRQTPPPHRARRPNTCPAVRQGAPPCHVRRAVRG